MYRILILKGWSKGLSRRADNIETKKEELSKLNTVKFSSLFWVYSFTEYLLFFNYFVFALIMILFLSNQE